MLKTRATSTAKLKSLMLYIFNIKRGKYNIMCEIDNRVEKMRSQEFTTLGSTLVILGVVFGENRLIGYSFIGAGVLLSIISIVKSKRKAGEAKSSKGC